MKVNRKDFLDILSDYLKGTFSEMEINDILRDYEEFFLNGELNGKSDEEIIKSLGSPKVIARELIAEMKASPSSKVKEESELKEKVNKGAKNIWNGVKSTSKKTIEKSKEFLDSSSIINGDMSSTLIKFIMIVVSCILFIPAVFIASLMATGGITLICISITNFLGFIVSGILMGFSIKIGLFGIFLCIAWMGWNILCWLLYCLIFKLLKHLVVEYISWIKSRNMYVRVKEKYKEEKVKEDNKEEAIVDIEKYEEKNNGGDTDE